MENNLIQTHDSGEVLHLLKTRYKADQPYTQNGSHQLIIINPHKPLDLLNDATLEAYGQHGYKYVHSTHNEQDPEPHVYDLATKMYLLLRRRDEDQAVVLR